MRSLTLDGRFLVKERCSPLVVARFIGLRRYSQSALPKLPAQASPAQLLRFALTGTTCSGLGDSREQKLDRRLISQFEKKRIPSRSDTVGHALSHLPKDLALPPFAKQDGLSRLQANIVTFINSKNAGVKLLSPIEPLQHALDQCQTRVEREDLIATLNGLLARLRRLGVKDTRQLLLLGMKYAAEASSAHSLAYYTQQYSDGEYGQISRSDGISLINSLSIGLNNRSWEEPSFDRTVMLNVVAGVETGSAENATLASLLDISDIRENELLPKYIRLLGKLEGKHFISDLLPQLYAELESEPNAVVVKCAVAFIDALLDLGNAERALFVARHLSQHIDLNGCLPLTTWKSLLERDSQGLLRDLVSPQTTTSMLQYDLRPLEFILGTSWVAKGDDGYHIHSHDMAQFLSSGDVDSACTPIVDYPNPSSRASFLQQIRTVTQVDGFSRSLAGLSLIADLLNEHEGIEIPINVKAESVEHAALLDYAWFPSCSSLEFLGDMPSMRRDIDRALSPAALGLVTARISGNGVLLNSLGGSHLMQLGYIGTRTSRASNDTRTIDTSNEKWRNTGHIIAWDRRSGELVILWTGKPCGILKPGPVKPAPPPELPWVFGKVTVRENAEVFISQIDSIGPLKQEQSYWIGVDAGNDLIS